MQVSGCEKLKPLPPFRLCQGECQLQELAQQGRGREPKCKNRGEDLFTAPKLFVPPHSTVQWEYD